MKIDKKLVIAIVISIVFIIIVAMILSNKKEDTLIYNNDIVNNVSSPENKVEILKVDDTDKNEFIEIKADGTKMNKSRKFATTKKINGLEISNIKLTEKNNLTEINAEIKNTTNKDVEGFYVKIIMLDKEENEIVGIGGYIPFIKANGREYFNTSSTGNFVNAYDYKIEKIED